MDRRLNSCPLPFRKAEGCRSVYACTAYQLLHDHHHQKKERKHPFNQSTQKRYLFFRCTPTAPPDSKTAGTEFRPRIGARGRLSEGKMREMTAFFLSSDINAQLFKPICRQIPITKL